jgi:hypothetical protein
MPKLGWENVGESNTLQVHADRERERRRAQKAEKESSDRGRMLLQSKQQPYSDFTEARARLVFAFLYHLLRNTGSPDVKSLSFLSAVGATNACKEDQIWFADILNQVKHTFPEGFF